MRDKAANDDPLAKKLVEWAEEGPVFEVVNLYECKEQAVEKLLGDDDLELLGWG